MYFQKVETTQMFINNRWGQYLQSFEVKTFDEIKLYSIKLFIYNAECIYSDT